MNLEFEIDELLLEGFAPGDRHRVAEAARLGLEGLFRGEGVPASLAGGHSPPTIDAGAFALPPGARPEAAGRLLARAIYRGLGAGEEPGRARPS